MLDKQSIGSVCEPSYSGVWLDHGELNKIIERSVVHHSQTTFNPHNNTHDSHYYN